MNPIFRQYYSEPFYEAWERFKDGFVWQELSQCLFYLGLNEDTRSWVDDGAMASGCPSFLRNANDAYFLFEDMANYNYHWHLSLYNAQQHKDPLEDLQRLVEKLEESTREMHLQTISFLERVQEPVREEILLDEEPMEQPFEEEPCCLEEEPSFSNEVELSPQEANECELPLQPMEQQFEVKPCFLEEVEVSLQQLEQQFVVELSPQEVKECALPLPMILISPQSTPNLPKIHPFLLVFLTPSCGRIPYFIDYLDTQPPIPFMLTCFVAGSPRVVDYATLHGRKPLFEHTECLAKDIEN